MIIEEQRKTFFQKALLKWYAGQDRPMPWKGERDPYLIWLSEIILQQTRVAQGMPYFERFRAKYPSVHDLAAAPEDEVMKLWEGLGYYSRARNLHATAKHISEELKGEFPNTYDDILQLKGVGPYTAAAIASFAYHLPHAVLDGNVFRVLARYEGYAEAVDSSAAKTHFNRLAQDLLLSKKAAVYNQAIMDFGATQCVPKSPNCGVCPLATKCIAQQRAAVESIPYKAKKLKRQQRYFHYFLMNQSDQVWIKKRVGKGIWQNLYEFPLIETQQADLNEDGLLAHPLWQEWMGDAAYQIDSISPSTKQDLTHQRIFARFWEVRIAKSIPTPPEMRTIKRTKLRDFAFPKLIDWYLQDNSLFLKLV